MKKETWYNIRLNIDVDIPLKKENKCFSTLKQARDYLKSLPNFYTGHIIQPNWYYKVPTKVQSVWIKKYKRTKSNRWKSDVVLWTKKERQKYKNNLILKNLLIKEI